MFHFNVGIEIQSIFIECVPKLIGENVREVKVPISKQF